MENLIKLLIGVITFTAIHVAIPYGFNFFTGTWPPAEMFAVITAISVIGAYIVVTNFEPEEFSKVNWKVVFIATVAGVVVVSCGYVAVNAIDYIITESPEWRFAAVVATIGILLPTSFILFIFYHLMQYKHNVYGIEAKLDDAINHRRAFDNLFTDIGNFMQVIADNTKVEAEYREFVKHQLDRIEGDVAALVDYKALEGCGPDADGDLTTITDVEYESDNYPDEITVYFHKDQNFLGLLDNGESAHVRYMGHPYNHYAVRSRWINSDMLIDTPSYWSWHTDLDSLTQEVNDYHNH